MRITKDHLDLLKHMTFDWDDDCEWGAVSSDPKRPFGNSNVRADVEEILGRAVDTDEARRLTIELSAIVQLVVFHAARGDAKILGVGAEVELPWHAARLLGVRQ